MSEFQTTLAISVGILAVMILSQYGRRRYDWRRLVIPLVAVAAFGWSYLHDAPTGRADLGPYAVGVVIGLVFAALTTVSTGIEQEGAGGFYTRCGAAFVVIWLVAVALRIGFVWGVDNLAGFRQQVGLFLMHQQIAEAAIAPFFVLMALTTVVGRVIALRVRMSRLPRAAVDTPATVGV